MALFSRSQDVKDLSSFLRGFSVEVMPRTAAKIADFRAILPANSLVFVAHIDGTPFDDMARTVARLMDEGLCPVPHIPARIIPDKAMLDHMLATYDGLGVRRMLLLGGGVNTPKGPFESSITLLETGLFNGLDRIYIAGHPEGNRDIDPDGGESQVMAALRWKQDFARTHGICFEIVTQFCFEPEPVVAWVRRLHQAGITLPVRIGIAGPAKLQTMIKFAMACGVGPSMRVLQRRARDMGKLLLPFEPDALIAALAAHRADHPDFTIHAAHFFPLGGITATTDWIARHSPEKETP